MGFDFEFRLLRSAPLIGTMTTSSPATAFICSAFVTDLFGIGGIGLRDFDHFWQSHVDLPDAGQPD